MAVKTVLVDLGGTLVDFFGTLYHTQLVPAALTSAGKALGPVSLSSFDLETLERRWNAIRRDPADLRAKPLEDRLAAVFDIPIDDRVVIDLACRGFMRPLYRRARVYEDAVPFLRGLKARGLTIVLVSNTTWGSPSYLWREELENLGLDGYLDGTVFCRDVGWRKPDPRIFVHALSLAKAKPSEAVFVGDDPQWDVEGPSSLGIPAVLVDRHVQWVGSDYQRITGLLELLEDGRLG